MSDTDTPEDKERRLRLAGGIETPPPPPLPRHRVDLKNLTKEDYGKYLEGVWRKCETCNPYTPNEACLMCFGEGVYLRMQYSAQVIDATDRLETNVDPNWRIGDKP